MDAELKVLLVALAEGEVKLAEGQGRMETAVAHLVEGQGRHDERLGRMESAVAHLATATTHMATATEAALTRLVERIDEFGERVTRGFTNGAATDHKLDDEIHALDARVTKLERKKTGPPKRR